LIKQNIVKTNTLMLINYQGFLNPSTRSDIKLVTILYSGY